MQLPQRLLILGYLTTILLVIGFSVSPSLGDEGRRGSAGVRDKHHLGPEPSSSNLRILDIDPDDNHLGEEHRRLLEPTQQSTSSLTTPPPPETSRSGEPSSEGSETIKELHEDRSGPPPPTLIQTPRGTGKVPTESLSPSEPSASEPLASDPQVSLGCFTREGEWTQDRLACASDQEHHHRTLKRTLEEEPSRREEFEERIPPIVLDALPAIVLPPERILSLEEGLKGAEIWFLDTGKREEQRRAVAAAIMGAQENFVKLQDIVPLPAYAKDYLTLNVRWLQGAETFAKDPVRTPQELETVAQTVKEVIGNAASILQSVDGLPRGPAPDITSITGRTERIIQVLPNALLFLIQEGVRFSEEVVSRYLEAARSFGEVKPACERNRDACVHLSTTLDHLEHIKTLLEEAITNAGKPELRDRIEEMFKGS
jgi:hypothetical protein